MSKRGILILLSVFVLAFALLGVGKCGYGELESVQSLEKAAAYTRKKFPQANPISVQTLLLYQKGQVPLLLVDVRAKSEFEVSRIPSALHFTKIKELTDHLSKSPESPESIVIYDSVGFRSAKFASDLSGVGVSGAVHLEGGIFDWANQDLPLVDSAGRPVKKVHPCNKTWGRLLKPEYRYSIKEKK